MTTYILILLVVIVVLLIAVLMRPVTVDLSALREDNSRLLNVWGHWRKTPRN